MRLTASYKRQLLIIIIDCSIHAAKQNKLGIGIEQLKGLKKSLETEGLDQVDKKFKNIFKGLTAQLSIIFGIPIDKKWKEHFKFTTKKWKEINNGMDIDVEALSNYLKEQLPFLTVSHDKMIATSSELSEKSTPSLRTGHGRQRSNTGDFSSAKPGKTLENHAPAPVTGVSPEKVPDSRDLRAQFKKRGFSFWRPSLEAQPSSSSDSTYSSKVPLLKMPDHNISAPNISKTSVKDFFSDLFAIDSEKTTQFVMALAKDKAKLAWNIQVLNAASDKHATQIAEVLINHLTTEELIAVFSELFKLEKQLTWSRGNQLFFTLMRCYLTGEEVVKFKESLWNELYSLADPISKITIKQRASMILHPNGFSADGQHINQLQERFAEVLKKILIPQNFPPLMQHVIRQAYIALANRDDFTSSVDRTFMSFVLLRFINAIIAEEAPRRLVTSHVKQMEDAQIEILKTWYQGTLVFAIQSLTSPIRVANNKTPTSDASHVDKDFDNETLHDEMFGILTQDQAFRTALFDIIKMGLQLDNIVVEKPSHNDTKIPLLDEVASIKKLNDLLKLEKHSGYSFKADGSVTPGRHEKTTIISFFPSDSEDSDVESASDAATPR